jgi:hypothetical protein
MEQQQVTTSVGKRTRAVGSLCGRSTVASPDSGHKCPSRSKPVHMGPSVVYQVMTSTGALVLLVPEQTQKGS